MESLGGKFAGIYVNKLKDGTLTFYVSYRNIENKSVKEKVGLSPDMTKQKALLILNEKKEEVKRNKELIDKGSNKSTILRKSKTHPYTLNEVAEIYIEEYGKNIKNLDGVKSSHNYHIKNEAFAQKPLQLITRNDVKEFIEKKHLQKADKGRVLNDGLSVEEREFRDYEKNEKELRNLRSYLLDTEDNLKWIIENKIEYLETTNEVLRNRIDPISSKRIMKDNYTSIHDKKRLLGYLSNKTIKLIVSQCEAMISYVNYERELTLNNPFKLSSRDKSIDLKIDNIKDRFLTTEELKVFSKELKRVSELYEKHQNIYLMFLLALSTAARQSTVLSIKIGDIDLENNLIYLRNHKASKNFISKIGSNEIKELIINLIGKRSKNEFLFASVDEKKYVRFPRIIGEILNYTVNCNRTYLNRLSIKDFRNTTASHLAMSGMSLFKISKLLDHSDIQITQRYTHLIPKSEDDAIGEILSSFSD